VNRSIWIVLALLATAGAAPARRQLPVPPIPPANPPSSQVAPTPDRDSTAPADTAGNGIQVRPYDFRVRRFKDGMGFAPGSQFESAEDKRAIQTPGVSVRVPLQ